MAVTSFELIKDSGKADAAGMRNFTVVYRAISNNPNDHSLTILSSPLMPTRPNSPYFLGNDIDLMTYAHEASAEREFENRINNTRWIVTISFQSRPRRQKPQEVSEFSSPLNQPPQIRGEFTDQNIVVEKDLDGEAILNSAGERLPTIEIPAPLFRLQITINKAELDIPQSRQYAKRSQNSDEFWGAEAGTVLCAGVKFAIEFWGIGVAYYPHTYDFLFLDPDDNRPDWQLHILDAGPRYWSGGGIGQGKLVTFRDDEGSPHADGIGLLDGAGGALIPGGLQEPETLEFRVMRELPFGALGVPTSNPF